MNFSSTYVCNFPTLQVHAPQTSLGVFRLIISVGQLENGNSPAPGKVRSDRPEATRTSPSSVQQPFDISYN